MPKIDNDDKIVEVELAYLIDEDQSLAFVGVEKQLAVLVRKNRISADLADYYSKGYRFRHFSWLHKARQEWRAKKAAKAKTEIKKEDKGAKLLKSLKAKRNQRRKVAKAFSAKA